MNKHLNIYKTYTKVNRKNGELEDDLTRALAIVLQENDVFLHQFLKHILNKKEKAYDNLFDDYTNKSPIEIDIQKPVESIEGFDHLFAVRISGDAMGNDFFNQNHDRDYNAVTDMFIKIDSCAIILEVKPRNHNSTAQLYNQALNAIKSNDELNLNKDVTPVDFNWPLIMETAVRVNNYQTAIGKSSRILDNFISYIKKHNYEWLPQLSLSALSFHSNQSSIEKRFRDVIENSEYQSINGRLGFNYNFGWAQELLISFDNDKEQVIFSIYPGNTKSQGERIFKQNGEPNFKKELDIKGTKVRIDKLYHIKFSSFSSYFTGIWFNEEALKETLFTKANFWKFSGRKKRAQHWDGLAQLFDKSFKEDFNWREVCLWNRKVVGSNRSQFDLSFGYELKIKIPYREIQEIDLDKNNLEPLSSLLEQVKEAFKTVLIK